MIANLKSIDEPINASGQTLREILASGHTSESLASTIVTLMSRHKDPVAICLDHSRWDGHFNQELMSEAHNMWKIMSHNDHLLTELLKQQNFNKGVTQSGLRYKVTATRMSGEYTTSIENSLVNYAILQAVFPTGSVLVNGDDSVIFIDGKDLPNLDNLANIFLEFGQQTKIEKIADIIEHIEFCQCSPIYVDGQYKMVRKPDRVLSRSQYTSVEVRNEQFLNRYLTANGLCELSLNSGVPVLQQFSLKLMELGQYQKPTTTYDRVKQFMNTDELKVTPISIETRRSFELAFDIPINEQLSIEQEINAKCNVEFINKYKRFHIIRGADRGF
jgi:hypothetical protein